MRTSIQDVLLGRPRKLMKDMTPEDIDHMVETIKRDHGVDMWEVWAKRAAEEADGPFGPVEP